MSLYEEIRKDIGKEIINLKIEKKITDWAILEGKVNNINELQLLSRNHAKGIAFNKKRLEVLKILEEEDNK